jgi:hypothetical protein
MTDQLILGTAAVVVTLLIAYEVIETWRWRGYGNRPVSRFRVIRFFRRVIGGFFSIVTLRRWRHRNAAPEWTMSSDDVARRLGNAPMPGPDGMAGPVHLQPGRIVVSGAGAPVIRQSMAPVQPTQPMQPMQPVQPIREPRPPRPSRLRLARDTIGAALVLGGFIVVFANIVPPGPPQQQVEPASATPQPSVHVVGPITPAPASASPLTVASTSPDLGPTQTPSLASSTSSPTPKPTARPTSAPAPAITQAPPPTPKPTPTPTKKPKPPTPSPKPAPTVTLSADVSSLPPGGGTVQFTISASHAATYEITFDDGSSDSGAIPPSGSVSLSHAYNDPPPFHPVVIVQGPGGSASDNVTISAQ